MGGTSTVVYRPCADGSHAPGPLLETSLVWLSPQHVSDRSGKGVGILFQERVSLSPLAKTHSPRLQPRPLSLRRLPLSVGNPCTAKSNLLCLREEPQDSPWFFSGKGIVSLSLLRRFFISRMSLQSWQKEKISCTFSKRSLKPYVLRDERKAGFCMGFYQFSFLIDTYWIYFVFTGRNIR